MYNERGGWSIREKRTIELLGEDFADVARISSDDCVHVPSPLTIRIAISLVFLKHEQRVCPRAFGIGHFGQLVQAEGRKPLVGQKCGWLASLAFDDASMDGLQRCEGGQRPLSKRCTVQTFVFKRWYR